MRGQVGEGRHVEGPALLSFFFFFTPLLVISSVSFETTFLSGSSVQQMTTGRCLQAIRRVNHHGKSQNIQKAREGWGGGGV